MIQLLRTPRSARPSGAGIGKVEARHAVVLAGVGLWLAVIGIYTAAGRLAYDLATTYLLVILLQATLSLSPRLSHRTQHFYAAGALLTANAVLVQVSGHQPWAHMLFAVVLTLLTLYQSLSTYLGAVSYLALYYLVFEVEIRTGGVWAGGSWRWAVAFFAIAVGASLAGVVGWVLHARTASETQALRVRLAEAGLREKQARELNDTVVQHLVTVLYAAEEGDSEITVVAARDALGSARRLVSSLLAADWVHDAASLVREAPSQNHLTPPAEDRDSARAGGDEPRDPER